MLLTITTTHKPATDLGYLLAKNPARFQSFDLSFGKAHVFYPEAGDDRCTVALLLDIDAVGLVRGKHGEGRSLAQYVNDRPYVASSYLSVAIAQVLGSALSGRCKDRPDLAETPIPLTATIPVMPSRGGDEFLRRLFEPLGYTVTLDRLPLDPHFPDWGESHYYRMTLEKTGRLSDLLAHLYVLVPTLDYGKHYFVGDEEVEKLLARGEGWLGTHPERDTIVNRYLRHKRSLIHEALSHLIADEEPVDAAEEVEAVAAEKAERGPSLHDQRHAAVLAALKEGDIHRVLDLGCGEGRLLSQLLKDHQFTEILGMDVSYRELERAQDKLKLDRLAPMQRARINLILGSVIYRDRRLEGYDAAAVVEVVEHLDPPRLAAFERVLFEFARPGRVVLTTPNRDYNPKFETLPAGQLRHGDHRFEWTRAEFQDWTNGVCARFGYTATLSPVGPQDPEAGAPSQMAVFERSPADG